MQHLGRTSAPWAAVADHADLDAVLGRNTANEDIPQHDLGLTVAEIDGVLQHEGAPAEMREERALGLAPLEFVKEAFLCVCPRSRQ